MALREEVTVLARRQPARKQPRKEEAVSALGVVAPPPIEVESPHFSGSLAALFACVRERKIDLLDVPLLPICEAYFIYLLQANLKDLDQAAVALTALAYLLERKAWALLPIAEPVPEIEETLELPPPSTGQYEIAITALSIWQEEREQMFFRQADAGPELYELPFELTNVTAADLARAFERLLAKATPEPIAPLNRPRKSISEQMKMVFQSLSSEWKCLDELVTLPFTREEAVYWFLSLLELIRLGQATVRRQDEDVQFARAA